MLAAIAGQQVPTAGGGLVVVEGMFDDAGSSGTSATIPNVISTAGTKIVVVVGIRDLGESDRPISSVVRNGQSFTRSVVVDDNDRQSAEVWYLDSPTASNHDTVVTFGGNVGFSASAALVLTGTAAGAAEATNETFTGGAADPSLAVASTVGSLVVDMAVYDNSDGGHSFGAGQTDVVNISPSRRRASSYKVATATSTTMSQTNSSTRHTYLVASFAPA